MTGRSYSRGKPSREQVALAPEARPIRRGYRPSRLRQTLGTVQTARDWPCMKRYYFDLREDDALILDEEGIELPSLKAAH